MSCKNCPKSGGANPGTGRARSTVWGPGQPVKVRYLGDPDELHSFEGAATRKVYTVGGRINLLEVDSRDLGSRHSATLGLLQLTDDQGHRLFEVHVPLKEEIEAEARARAMEKEAWKNAEELALPPEAEEAPKPKRRKAKSKVKPIEPEAANGEDSVPGD